MVIILLGIFTSTVVVQAQNTSIDATRAIPKNVDIYFSLDTTVANPLSSFMPQIGEEMTFMMTETGASATQTQAINTLKPKLLNNHYGVALRMNKTETAPAAASDAATSESFVTLHLSSTDFTTLTTALGNPQTETYNGTTIYYNDIASVALLGSDLVIMNTNKAGLHEMIDDYTSGNNLQNNANFSATKAKFLPSSFAELYLNPATTDQLMTTQFGMDDTATVKNILQTLTSMGVSAAQGNNNIQISYFLKSDSAKLAALNLALNNNFIPAIYKNIVTKNILLYVEQNNLQKTIQDILTMAGESTQLDSISTEFQTNTGLNLQNDVLAVLNNKFAISIHSQDSQYPAISLIFDVKNNLTKANNIVTKLKDYASKQPETTVTTTTINGATFYQVGDTSTKISMGVSADGYLVLTNGNVTDVLNSNGALSTDSTFTGTMGQLNDSSINQINFINIDNLHSIASGLLNMMTSDQDGKDAINGLLIPWHSIGVKSNNNSDSLWGTISLSVDLNGFAQYPALITKLMTSELVNPPRHFCDVKSSDWFTTHVNSLSKKGYITGYSDGCFHPGSNISRAEFVTLLMKAMPSLTYHDDRAKQFKDVANGAWYKDYVDLAVENGIIKGYADNSFHPNAPIARAEAIQILMNVAAQFHLLEDANLATVSFQDLKKSDWYFNAVRDALTLSIISPSTRFNPRSSLNRAEAAKIIDLFLQHL
ncbi:MAG: S-layer homology domain-containing protein [Candidatus Gracilibacteria bacterium]